MKIGILGAGLIGAAVAKLATDRGHEVMISSRHPERLADLAIEIGCATGPLGRAAAYGEAILAAVPLSALGSIPVEPLIGKVVMDAMNYYPERDGINPSLEARITTTSELVAARLVGARVVKAFNAILAKDLPVEGRLVVTLGRRALPIAGNDGVAKQLVMGLHDEFGFDVLDTGSLADSWRFERAKPAYCIPLNIVELRQAISDATREGELPHGSWRR